MSRCTMLIVVLAGFQIDLATGHDPTQAGVYPYPWYAGDADRDGYFDHLDLAQVQEAGKYNTGRSATWGEGERRERFQRVQFHV